MDLDLVAEVLAGEPSYRVAQVWVPYDLYIGKTWSHCGVDAFTLLKSDGRWRVASLIYTIEQPPANMRHTDATPASATVEVAPRTAAPNIRHSAWLLGSKLSFGNS